jgi:hypothetical protein
MSLPVFWQFLARPTVFMEILIFSVLSAASIQQDGTIRLQFGAARTSPIAARHVSEGITRMLTDQQRHAARSTARTLCPIVSYSLDAALGEDLHQQYRCQRRVDHGQVVGHR